MVYIVRYNGKWYRITPKPYEPEYMTAEIAWIQIRQNISAADAYRMWFEQQRRISRLLQQ